MKIFRPKNLAIGALILFAYLGTGYQFATKSWEWFHSTEGREWLVNTTEGRFVAETMWPWTTRTMTSNMVEKAKKDTGKPNPILQLGKTDYLISTTLVWGPKIAWNILAYLVLVVFDIATFAIIILYSFVKFLVVVGVAFANLILSPFGFYLAS